MNEFVKAIGEKIDGQTYNLDGISGTLRYTESVAKYPYKHTVQRLDHVPDSTGKRTAAYQERKRQLGDDWISDLTQSDRLVEIATALGITLD